jgi:hypothetical protein
MFQGNIVATPRSVLPYAVVIRRDRAVIRREPAHDRMEAGRLLQRLMANAAADFC